MNNNISGIPAITPQTIEIKQEAVPVQIAPDLQGGVEAIVNSQESGVNTTFNSPQQTQQDPQIASGANAIAKANIPVGDTRVSPEELAQSTEPDSFVEILIGKLGGAPVSVGYK